VSGAPGKSLHQLAVFKVAELAGTIWRDESAPSAVDETEIYQRLPTLPTAHHITKPPAAPHPQNWHLAPGTSPSSVFLNPCDTVNNWFRLCFFLSFPFLLGAYNYFALRLIQSLDCIVVFTGVAHRQLPDLHLRQVRLSSTSNSHPAQRAILLERFRSTPAAHPRAIPRSRQRQSHFLERRQEHINSTAQIQPGIEFRNLLTLLHDISTKHTDPFA
jgi:hypothetical protein